MIKRLILMYPLFIGLVFSQNNTQRVPTIEDLLKINLVGAARISPAGKWVAYTMRSADLKQDAYVNHIWLVNSATGKNFQLTRGKKSAGNPKWSPDGNWLAFTSSRNGKKNQLFVIRPYGGEAQQITKSETGVGNYEWSKNGKSIAFVGREQEGKTLKARKEHLGGYEVVRKEYLYRHIWTVDIAKALRKPVKGTQRTKGNTFTVGSFSWSPDGSKIAFNATIKPDAIYGHTNDIYVLNLADNKIKKVVSQKGPDSNPNWSPDGKQIIFSSAMGNKHFYHSNSNLALISENGGTPRSITSSFDENPRFAEWNNNGIYFGGLQKTASHLFRLDPKTSKITRISKPDNLMLGSVSFTRDGNMMAFTAGSSSALNEVFITLTKNFAPRKLTANTLQTKNLLLGKREVISWKSKDGAIIEGVLIKPADFDPTKKYPLLCIIHGGPTGVSRPTMIDTRYYPSDIWVGRGALVLKVNYRGSAGYGEKFRQLNVRNLGVGDAWDVLSGVDHLISKGWVDPTKIATMGWSQGGYISAFLTTSSKRFAAVSVGAGISNWATYYYNTDITPFTIQYLGNDPAADPEIYKKTSPMSYIKQASTPTLIQHGEFDTRVPIPNAYELRQGLVDRGVKSEMIVYKGFGHGITKPRSMRAVMQHNLSWFNHYLWGDPLPDFTRPKVPKKKKPALE